jgi:hypothetical protein
VEIIKALWLFGFVVIWGATIYWMMEFNGLEVKNGKIDHAFTIFFLGLLVLLPLFLFLWPFAIKDVLKLKRDCSQYEQKRK